jgi:hypothetical protein
MSRNDRAWVATRKGLFELRPTGGTWRIQRVSFLGEPVTMLLPPDEQGRMLAAVFSKPGMSLVHPEIDDAKRVDPL